MRRPVLPDHEVPPAPAASAECAGDVVGDHERREEGLEVVEERQPHRTARGFDIMCGVRVLRQTSPAFCIRVIYLALTGVG